ncbi:class I SAM-dependent methyltransferase [Mesorhizobium sp.]|uniref:class I SAM-dependent methyltransferase n=1 Tax=Mesorhizobium sp. TaxID=1871066 RepID=UPI0026008F1E|nr:class I SAM-dependent methyltransferase [Mesorhizobium sp.]
MISGEGVRRRLIYVLSDFGKGRECPLCGWQGSEFRPRLNPRKPSADAVCPKCRSLERHRLGYFALRSRLKDIQNTLHFAPEKPMEKWLRSISSKYVSCDLEPGLAMEVEDITKLSYSKESFDFIWCSNVLEHVPDDRTAMSELRRVLTKGGTCVVAVPIWRRKTYEDPTVTTPEERLEKFGQNDHVRLYGLDIEDRLKAAGFNVEMITSRDFDPRDVGRYGLNHLTTGELFICT